MSIIKILMEINRDKGFKLKIIIIILLLFIA